MGVIQPKRCPVCGRLPAITKVKRGRYVATCWDNNCENKAYLTRETEKEVVKAWNEEAENYGNSGKRR